MAALRCSFGKVRKSLQANKQSEMVSYFTQFAYITIFQIGSQVLNQIFTIFFVISN